MKKNYTREMAIEEIKKCYEENQKINSALYVSQRRRPSVQWIIKEFGSWKNAVKEAELTNVHIFDYTEEYLIKQLQNCAKTNDGRISYEIYKKSNLKPSVDYIVKHFGTWGNALRKAKVGSQIILKSYTEIEMLTALKECYEFYGRLSRKLYSEFAKEKEYPSATSITQKFGSWNNALLKSNIPINKIVKKKYTKEDIIDGLQKCYEENEFHITTKIYEEWQFMNKEYAVLDTVTNYFGSWLNALEKAGIEYTKDLYTNEEMLEMLKENIGKMNGEFNYNIYTGENFKPSLERIKTRFGSLENAFEKINYHRVQNKQVSTSAD